MVLLDLCYSELIDNCDVQFVDMDLRSSRSCTESEEQFICGSDNSTLARAAIRCSTDSVMVANPDVCGISLSTEASTALRIAPEITLRKQLERQPDMLPN